MNIRKIFVGALALAALCGSNAFAAGGGKLSADVVVVGGGGAGLVSAITAAENGASVILLEKVGYLGGATMMSSGIIPAAGTSYQKAAGIEDTPEALAVDIFRPANYGQNQEYVRLVAKNAKEIVEWMKGLGVKWNLQTTSLYKGQSNYRMHQAENMGKGIVDVLVKRAKADPKITILLETPGTGLIVKKGRVIGVTAKGKDGKVLKVYGSSVILATSGFGANQEMLKKYAPSALGAYPRVAPGAMGEGILWGLDLGAQIGSMSAFQLYGPISNKTKAVLPFATLYNGGILVDKSGNRFTDEYLGYSELGAQIISQEGHTAFMIFDSSVAKTVPTKTFEEAGMVSADSAEDLAAKIDVPARNLAIAFAEYQAGIEKGEDRWNRTKLPKAWTAPFYAVDVTADLRHTQGGLIIDKDAEVLNASGTPIPGLYAAGGVTEGFSTPGGPMYMSGNGLLQAFVFGRIAGHSAVHK